MKILIIRHGEPDYSIDSLTEKGWREAELLSRRLAPLGIRDFYVSPLGRAQDTARPTLEKTGKQAETLPWLMEFRGQVWDPFGRMEQKKHIPWNLMPQYWTKCPDLFDKNAWLTHPLLASTGEVREVYEEIGAGVEELLLRCGYVREGMLFRCERNSRDTIALFCHFGAGLAILSVMSPEKVALAASSGDHKAFTKASGVGPKLAQRITLELKDKVGKGLAEGTGFGGGDLSAPMPSSAPAQAVAALVSLGYTPSDAAAAVARVDETLPVQDIIKVALRSLSRAR